MSFIRKNMQMTTSNPKVTQTKPLDSSKKSRERVKPLKVRATTGESDLKLPCGVRKNRTASCPRCPPRERTETASEGPKVTSDSQRRTRAASTAPKPITRGPDVKPVNKKPSFPDKQTTVETKCSQQRAHCQYQPSSTRHSHTAFTVIPPDLKKRLEIQKKAEAELIALEELRLSKATTFVSIKPSAVGGCLSLEEVRQKQQQEMTGTKSKPKQIKEQVMVRLR